MTNTDRLMDITLNEEGLATPTPEIEQERKVAIYDLLEDNLFGLEDERAPAGPYRLHIRVAEGRLVLEVATEGGQPAGEFHLSLSPLRQVIRDYFQICESYFEAVKRLPAAQIEAIDMGRRGIHDEGARVLEERLDGKIRTDKVTTRRLFTLVCVLHFKG